MTFPKVSSQERVPGRCLNSERRMELTCLDMEGVSLRCTGNRVWRRELRILTNKYTQHIEQWGWKERRKENPKEFQKQTPSEDDFSILFYSTSDGRTEIPDTRRYPGMDKWRWREKGAIIKSPSAAMHNADFND